MQDDPNRGPLESDQSIKLNHTEPTVHTEARGGEGIERTGKELGREEKEEIKGQGDSHVGDNSTRENEKSVGNREELVAVAQDKERLLGEEDAVIEGGDRKSGGEVEVTKQSREERVDLVDKDSLSQNEGNKDESYATEGDRIRNVEPNSTEPTNPSQSTTALPSSSSTASKPTPLDDASASLSLPLPTSSTPSTSPANPTRSISPNPPTTAPKRFSSSLSVNKKFLEKAGEKANKLETKPTTTRLATPPIPTPVSTSHPRLLTGKISTSNPSIALSTPNSNHSNPSQPSVNWSKKPATSSPSTTAPSSGATSSAAGKIGPLPGKANGSNPLVPKSSGPVWSSAGAATVASVSNASAGFGSSTKSYGGIGLGRGSGGGFGNFVGDFPTAAEAAYAKEARARAVMEQMQARERALQARAAAAAAQNANLLQNLDAFRGVHLDPNAHHWDEDEDDFLDTTIEFGDGTQYKITEEDATAAAAAVAAQQQEQAIRAAQTGARIRLGGEEDLREPSPSELARLETPLAPGEVDEQPVKSREERFGDDYDRSWPPKRPVPPPQQEKPRRLSHTEKDDANRNLFNDRLGKFEPAQHGHPPPSSAGPRRMSNSSSTGQDLPPHLLDRRDPSKSLPPRRPSVTSPRTRHQQLPPSTHHHEPPPRNAWPRRPSNDLPIPSHGRQLPPHLAAAAAAAANVPHHSSATSSSRAPSAPAAPSLKSPPMPSEVFSPPPQPLAALPEVATPIEVPAQTEADLEALHSREMHAAAERAKKRRQEEEQARMEQMERARKKAAELEAKMKAKETPAVVEPKKEEQIEEKVVVEKEKVSSWRATAKPPVVQSPPVAVPPPSTSHPTKILGREPSTSSSSTQQPTSILPRPTQPSSPSAEQSSALPSISAVALPPPPTQVSAWRRPSNPSSLPPPVNPRSQQRQLPPHLAHQAQTSLQPPVASSPPVDTSLASPSLPSHETVEKPISPPAIASPPTVPSSPSHERKTSAKSNPLGYKVPEVSQLDDLMSRIKGAMSTKEVKKEVTIEILGNDAREAKVMLETEKAKEIVPSVETNQGPTVKLPPSTKPLRSRSNDQPPASTSNSIPAEPRGRGRGRADGPRAPRVSLPTFENRDPLLPFSGTRRARSPSPPPAWKLYTVKIPPRPPHRAPLVRIVKLFLSLNNPRPVHVFSSNPLISGINPRRLSRDDILIPKRYVKAVPQCLVNLPAERITRRTQEEERASRTKPKPTPTVSIASKALLLRSAGLEGPESATTKEELATVSPPSESSSFAPRGRGRGRMPDSGSWRRAGESSETPLASEITVPELEVVAEQVEDVEKPLSSIETSPSRSRGGATLKSKLPVGSSIGFYRPSGAPPLDGSDLLAKDRSESAKMFMVTSELNGEKVEATPREETTAPGADLAAQSKMTPKSPPFKPKDMSSVLSSPSAAWTNKSLALSVLDPTASSVWSAAPVDTSVRARAISGNQPENSLQGIVDDDPSEALPSSLAELKSEDEQSNEGKEIPTEAQRFPSKDDAKLRAVAPSFSSFLHDSAAAIDTSSASPLPASSLPSSYLQQGQHRPQPLAFSGYASHHSIPPQSTPSPVNPYSPSTTAYSPQLYGNPASLYTRSYPPTYGLTSAASVSPYVTQPSSVASSLHHQAYSPASPIVSPMGYPLQSPSTAYARPPPPPPPSQSIPHGITNPALLASYNGGYGSARYGAVGAGPRPNLSQSSIPTSNPSLFSHGSRPSYGAAPHQTSSYLSQQQQQQQHSPYATSAYLPHNPSSPYSQPQPQPHSYRTEPSYLTNSYDYPTSSNRSYTGGGNSSTTMPSPVIVPQNLPPPPPFFPQPQSSGAAQNGYGIGSRVGGRFANSGAVGGGSGGGRPW